MAKKNKDELMLNLYRLSFIKKLAVHYRLIAPCPALKITPKELQSRYDKYGMAPVILSIFKLFDKKSGLTQKVAASIMIEIFCPGWRKFVDLETLGTITKRNDNAVRIWRKEVLNRDDHTCKKCGSKIKTEAHHIIKWVDAPWLRLIVENGITLCKVCHKGEHEKGFNA